MFDTHRMEYLVIFFRPEYFIVLFERNLIDAVDETPVVIQKTLSLGQYVHRSGGRADYTLRGALFHSGDHESGHYFAVKFCQGGRLFALNDHEIHELDDNLLGKISHIVTALVYSKEPNVTDNVPIFNPTSENAPDFETATEVPHLAEEDDPIPLQTVQNFPGSMTAAGSIEASPTPIFRAPNGNRGGPIFRARTQNGAQFATPSIEPSLSKDSEESLTPSPNTLKKKYKSLKKSTKKLQADHSNLMELGANQSKTLATQSNNVAELIAESKSRNAQAAKERQHKDKIAEDLQKRFDKERERKDKIAEDLQKGFDKERERKDKIILDQIAEQQRMNSRAEEQQKRNDGVLQKLIDRQEKEHKRKDDMMAKLINKRDVGEPNPTKPSVGAKDKKGVPPFTNPEPPQLCVTVYTQIAGLPTQFSLVLAPSISVDGVKAAVLAEYGMAVEHQLLIRGPDTKFNGRNELSGVSKVKHNDRFRLVFQIQTPVEETNGDGRRGTVTTVDNPMKNRCSVDFNGGTENKKYSSLTWVANL